MPTFLFLLLFMGVATMAWGGLLAAPWVPTLHAQRELLLENLPGIEDPKTYSGTIYDLGCGSGSILFACAEHFPNATCIGYDVALFPLFLGLIRKYTSPKRYKNVSLRFGNFFNVPLSDADVIVAFLMQKAYAKFIRKLQRDARPNTLVALEAWPLPNQKTTTIIRAEHLLSWYLYRVNDLVPRA